VKDFISSEKFQKGNKDDWQEEKIDTKMKQYQRNNQRNYYYD